MNRTIGTIAMALLCIPLLQACAFQRVTEHDGLETVIVDAETGAPVDGAGVYAVGYSSDQVRLLTTSDQNGAVLVAPSRKFSIQPLPPKESADLQLWACKDGFEPRQIAARSGWKVYFDAETHKLAQVRLKRDGGDTSASCPSRIPR